MLEDDPTPPRRKDTLTRRLLLGGGATLNDGELLELALGIKTTIDIPALLHADPLDLVESGLITEKSAARLVGCLELVRRLATRRSERPRLPTANAVWEWVRPSIAGARHEMFRVLCVDARSRLLLERVVSEGSVDSCHVDPREVFAPAIACRASAIILVHNHPSGDPEPSHQDLQLTLRLRQAGDLLSIKVLDHVIATETRFVSMVQRQMFESSSPGPRLQ